MKVSIITTVFNNRSHIVDCIESVKNQTYPNIEHILIDGGSTDGTLKAIEPYKAHLAYFISEKDNGIYDALNKGINKASGDIVGILHSDDMFCSPEVLSRIVDAFHRSQADLVYSKGIFIDRDDPTTIKRIYRSNKFKKAFLHFGWIPLHTTIFVRNDVFRNFGLYEQEYHIASDYEISLRWFKNDAIKKYYYNDYIVKMRLGGKSTSMRLQRRKSTEDLDIIKRYKLSGFFTLSFKIIRKIPQYLFPRILNRWKELSK